MFQRGTGIWFKKISISYLTRSPTPFIKNWGFIPDNRPLQLPILRRVWFPSQMSSCRMLVTIQLDEVDEHFSLH